MTPETKQGPAAELCISNLFLRRFRKTSVTTHVYTRRKTCVVTDIFLKRNTRRKSSFLCIHEERARALHMCIHEERAGSRSFFVYTHVYTRRKSESEIHESVYTRRKSESLGEISFPITPATDIHTKLTRAGRKPKDGTLSCVWICDELLHDLTWRILSDTHNPLFLSTKRVSEKLNICWKIILECHQKEFFFCVWET